MTVKTMTVIIFDIPTEMELYKAFCSSCSKDEWDFEYYENKIVARRR